MRCVAAFIANRRRIAFVFQNFCQRVKNFRAHSNCVCKSCRASWNNHIFLKISRTQRMLTAVHHVDHRHRQAHCRISSQAIDILIQLHATRLSSSFRYSQRHRQNSIRTQTCLIRRTVQTLHFFINCGLVERIRTFQSLRNFTIDIFDRTKHAFTAKCQLAVPKLNSLERTSACARRNSRTPKRTVTQSHVRLNRRISTRI